MDKNYIILFSLIAIIAYLIQLGFTMLQIKHFNKIYSSLRRKGKVAIGTRPGKISSGTIIMFALNNEDKIIEARKMQGVTVLANFKELKEYVGEDIHFIDRKHPLVQKENKLTQIAMENARELFLRFEMGNYVEEKKYAPIDQLLMNSKLAGYQILNKFKRSV